MVSTRHFEQVPVQELKDIVIVDSAGEVSSSTPCSVCGHPVPLETCKVDEGGKAVHARCYVEKMGVARSRF